MLSDKAARFSFAILLLFGLFQSGTPFAETARDLAETSRAKQIILPLLYLLAVPAILTRRRAAFGILWRERYLAAFAGLCLASVLWSAYPAITFKQSVQVLGMTMVLLGAWLAIDSPDALLRLLRRVFLLWLPITAVALLAIPAAIDWESGINFRGFAAGKNQFGQHCLLATITFAACFLRQRGLSRWVSLAALGASLVMLVGSGSVTSWVTVLAAIALTIIWRFHRRFMEPMVGRAVSIILVGLGTAGVAILAIMLPAMLSGALDAVGRDATLTGRVEIWQTILAEIPRHWLLGAGFGAFWVPGSPVYDAFRIQFQWQANSAHMGYLDILNETGLVGLALLLAMILNYLQRILFRSQVDALTPFFLCALVLNLTESTFFRGTSPTGIMFLLAYYSPFVARAPGVGQQAARASARRQREQLRGFAA